jgi:hypothetical protein
VVAVWLVFPQLVEVLNINMVTWLLFAQVPAGEIWRSLNATIVGLAVSNASEGSRSVPYCVGLGNISVNSIFEFCFVFSFSVSLQKHLGFDWLPGSFWSETLNCFVISIIISFGPWPQPICSWRKFI